jgi:hypothetical protein
MSITLGGTNPAVTFPDGTIQNTSAVVGGSVPYSVLPTGSVLQVVSATYGSSFSTTSTSFTATGLSATITPKFSNSKILIITSSVFFVSGSGFSGYYTVYRGTTSGTNLGNTTGGFAAGYGSSSAVTSTASANYLDSPSTTAATTYTVAIRSETGTAVYTSPNSNTATITLMEIAG